MSHPFDDQKRRLAEAKKKTAELENQIRQLKISKMQPTNGHGGFAGKSLIDKIRDDLDNVLAEAKDREKSKGNGNAEMLDYKYGLIDGIAHALGVLRSSSMEQELSEAEKRWGATAHVGSVAADTP